MRVNICFASTRQTARPADKSSSSLDNADKSEYSAGQEGKGKVGEIMRI